MQCAVLTTLDVHIFQCTARRIDSKSAEYRVFVDEIVHRLHDTIESLAAAAIPAGPADGTETDDSDILDVFEKFEIHTDDFLDLVNAWTGALNATAETLSGQNPAPQRGSARAMRTWVTGVASAMRDGVEDLDIRTKAVRSAWAEVDAMMAEILAFHRSAGSTAGMNDDFRDSVRGLAAEFDAIDAVELANIEAQIGPLRQVRQLRSLARTWLDALDLFKEMRTAAQAWANAVDVG